MKISAKLKAGQWKLYIKKSIKSITPPKYILSIALPKAPEAIKLKLILINFFSVITANNPKKLPTTTEKIEKKYLPTIPPSLNIPKLIPVFLTKTKFKNSCLSCH